MAIRVTLFLALGIALIVSIVVLFDENATESKHMESTKTPLTLGLPQQ